MSRPLSAPGAAARCGSRRNMSHLTRRFFAEQRVTDYRIVESLGATEGAPAAGQAELIVDITTTGATLRANALKVLDDGIILRSQANFIASGCRRLECGLPGRARVLLSRITAEEEARMSRKSAPRRRCRPRMRPRRLRSSARGLCSAFRPKGPLTLVCPQDRAAPLADWLIEKGAEHVSVGALDYVFSAKNALYEKLVSRLG